MSHDSPPAPTINGTPRTRGGRVWLFRIIAILLPFLFLGVVEFGLRVAGVGYPTSFLVPMAGETATNRAGLLEDNYKFAWRFFPKALARAPQPIVVAKQKPKDTVRILVMGGSAAMGDPEPAYGMPRILQVLLEHRYANTQFEVVNCAVTAINSHVVLPIAKDCRRLKADAWVVYLGNNEVHGPFGAGTVFGGNKTPLWMNRASLALKSTKLGQLAFGLGGKTASEAKSWGGMAMFLDHQIRLDDPALDRVYRNYQTNLTDIIEAAPKSTTVVASTVVTNLRDSPPFVSVETPAAWQAEFAAACAKQEFGDHQAALTEFTRLAQSQPQHAELMFRQAECLLSLGDATGAKQNFARARDLDALRFRADTRINAIVREVAQSTRAELVDAVTHFEQASTDGVIGSEWLHEHVHLNFAGNYLLAKLIATQLQVELTKKQLLPTQATNVNWVSQAQCAEELGLTPYHRLLTMQEMRGRLNAPPFTGQSNHAVRDRQLVARGTELSKALTKDVLQKSLLELNQRVTTHPNDWMLRQQFAKLLDSVGDLESATTQYREIVKLIPNHAISHFQLGALLNRTKQWTDAETALRRSLEIRPQFARASNSLGICLSHQKRFEESHEQFQQAVEVRPSFAEAFYNWGLVLTNQDKQPAALQKYRQAVAADGAYLPARLKLGNLLTASKSFEEALPHYEAVARLRPNEAAAHLNLGMLCVRIGGRREQAMKHLRRTIQLDPNNQLAHQTLEQLR